MNKSLFFDFDAQQTGQLNSLQWTNFQSFQFKRPDLANANAADVRIGERKSAQAGAEEFGLCQVAPVSYTHLDVYKRQVYIGPEAYSLYTTSFGVLQGMPTQAGTAEPNNAPIRFSMAYNLIK